MNGNAKNETSGDCGCLEAFLNDELSPTQAAEFESHVAACIQCRDAVDQQRWIDGLLRSTEAAEIESAPVAIISRRPVNLRKVGVVAATVAVLAAWSWFEVSHRIELIESGRPPIAKSKTGMLDAGRPAASFQETDEHPAPVATFVSSGSTIALPVENGNPDVTVVRLYPTLHGSMARSNFTSYLASPKGTGDEL
jgi:anti-sigma factor RsiW